MQLGYEEVQVWQVVHLCSILGEPHPGLAPCHLGPGAPAGFGKTTLMELLQKTQPVKTVFS